MVHAVAVHRRAGGEIVGPARASGIELLDQPHQHAAIPGVNALQGNHVEVRQNADQHVVDLMVGQLGLVQPVHIECDQPNERAARAAGGCCSPACAARQPRAAAARF